MRGSRGIRAELWRPRGSRAAQTAGRLRRGGAAPPGAKELHGDVGRAGLGPPGRVLPRAASRGRTAPSSSAEKPPLALGLRVGPGRWRRPGPRRSGRFQDGGPGRLRVRASGRRASPALSERLRPVRQAPAKEARAGPLPQPVRPLPRPPPSLTVGLGLSTATGKRRLVSRQLQPARPQPRTRGPAPCDSSAAGARALTSHAPSCQPRPTPPPHVTPPRLTPRACVDTPRFLRPGRPRPNVSSPLTAGLGTERQTLSSAREECRKIGKENSEFATLVLAFRPTQKRLQAGWGGEARGR